MSWIGRVFFDEPEDTGPYIRTGQKVIGTRGGYRNKIGTAQDDEFDHMGTAYVKVTWQGGDTQTVPKDCLSRHM